MEYEKSLSLDKKHLAGAAVLALLLAGCGPFESKKTPPTPTAPPAPTAASRLEFINGVTLIKDPQKPGVWLVQACTHGFGGIGITMKASINEANNGSDKGQWAILKELGVPCFHPDSDNPDNPELRPEQYTPGKHRLLIRAHVNGTPWEVPPGSPDGNKVIQETAVVKICQQGQTRTVCN